MFNKYDENNLSLRDQVIKKLEMERRFIDEDKMKEFNERIENVFC